MTAQTVRLNTIASNLANANSVAGSEASTYRLKKPVFAPISVAARSSESWPGVGVQVLDVVTIESPVRKEHQPGNPLADGNGHVYYPNVNPIDEMTDMMSASRAFQTNAEVLISLRAMQRSLLELGESV